MVTEKMSCIHLTAKPSREGLREDMLQGKSLKKCKKKRKECQEYKIAFAVGLRVLASPNSEYTVSSS